jgi:uncharacterized protein YndB with AHSA1/START domain
VDDVFKALADPTRRSLLDGLFKKDGQTLSALEATLADDPLRRHEAPQIAPGGWPRRDQEARAREAALPERRPHPAPPRPVGEQYTWVATLSELKNRLENKTMTKVFEIYIKTTPERLWKAITDTEMRSKYTFGAVVTSDWTAGSPYKAVGKGNLIFEGENLEVHPPRRLVQSFRALWGEDVKSEGTSRVTYEIEPIGDSCRLIVTHDQLREDANGQLYGGWPMILSGLKTLLETGEMLTTPGSQRFS